MSIAVRQLLAQNRPYVRAVKSVTAVTHWLSLLLKALLNTNDGTLANPQEQLLV